MLRKAGNSIVTKFKRGWKKSAQSLADLAGSARHTNNPFPMKSLSLAPLPSMLTIQNNNLVRKHICWRQKKEARSKKETESLWDSV
ncbi:unnamed protein product [Cuscuta campestris]|uniref:Uncharacterized protein n=1 Tax=Cuscuta campestris TaxID=132261 RepID=A0A484MR78_9ASTE|nr:unnamed protein product [Cuscuta campestris]